MMLRMHSTMPQRSSLPKNNADGVSSQRATGGEERRQLGNAGQAKPVSRERIQTSRETAAKPPAIDVEPQSEATEDGVPAGREARFRSDLDQVAQQLRGIQFGSLMITIQDGVVVQLDRTERTRLRKPQLGAPSENDQQPGASHLSQTPRREPRHPDC